MTKGQIILIDDNIAYTLSRVPFSTSEVNGREERGCHIDWVNINGQSEDSSLF